APELTGVAEGVRWHARHNDRPSRLIELPEVGAAPHVSRVVRHEHGHVADHADAAFVGVTPELEPLADEHLLAEPMRLDDVAERVARLSERGRLTTSQRGSPRPPTGAVVLILERGEERVVLDPRGRLPQDLIVVPAKLGITLDAALEVMKRLFEDAALV